MEDSGRYILTGAPGAGKTTLIRLLETQGYFVVEEAATDCIALAQAQGIPEPWTEPSFIDRVVALQKQRQVQAATLPQRTVFFDRSPLDTYALCLFLGYPVSPLLSDELDWIENERVYQKQVFFIQNLGFCVPSEARKISFEESLRFEKIHEEVYTSWNYDCIRIPPGVISERVDAILRCL